jgi:hypothetical protein
VRSPRGYNRSRNHGGHDDGGHNDGHDDGGHDKPKVKPVTVSATKKKVAAAKVKKALTSIRTSRTQAGFTG